MKPHLTHFLHCLILGAIVGLTAALFLSGVNASIHYVWEWLPSVLDVSFYGLGVGLLGGIGIGLIQKSVGDYPKTMHETLANFKQEGRVPYRGALWKNAVAAWIVLTCGASLGPEAALISILGGMVTWIGDRLRLTEPERQSFLQTGYAAMLATIFHAPFVSVSEAIEEEPMQQTTSRWPKIQRIFYYGICTLVAFACFRFLMHLVPHDRVFAIKIPPINWNGTVIWFILPAILLGIVFGLFFLWMERVTNWVVSQVSNPILLALIAGIAIGLASMLTPYLLFSGEHEILDFTKEGSSWSIGALLLLAIGKVGLTHLCFSCGWKGGKIFPLIFSSTVLAFCLSQLSPFMPGLIVTLVVTASCAVVLRQPLVTATLLLFLFPLQFFPLILLVCLGVQQFMKYYGNHLSLSDK
ncbi:chloride channel protein [Exiguobacterium indicum]|uniref:chloride channel protein n=1 Tax=Exiguobacterium indicum TaxID=296995 RepID=UPI002B25EE4F|nr:chloride channel protein [Exiguobacterium indicum]